MGMSMCIAGPRRIGPSTYRRRRARTHASVCLDVYMYMETHIEMCVDMCVDMHAYRHDKEARRLPHVHAHMLRHVHKCVHRSACTHAFRHVCRNVHEHVWFGWWSPDTCDVHLSHSSWTIRSTRVRAGADVLHAYTYPSEGVLRESCRSETTVTIHGREFSKLRRRDNV